MADKIRVGILSTAHLHTNSYAEALQMLPTAEFVGVWDDNEERLAQKAAAYGVPAVAEQEALLAGCDAVIVVTAPKFLQDQRVLKRPGMSRQRLDEILEKQMPDAEKRQRADFVVPTGLGKRASRVVLARILRKQKPA